MKETIVAIVVAVIGSGAFFSFIQFLISRHDNKKGAINLNLYRLQLMVLMADYPDKADEIFEVAKYYFTKLNGDFYITTLFESWLSANGHKEPDWFAEYKEKKKK